jgi:bisphosphoglycerate-independent phosphoglycerate mutase (AlkP superfamily)
LRCENLDVRASGHFDQRFFFEKKKSVHQERAETKLDGKCIVTADHGNCEQMRNPDGSPNTAHTTNLVHFIDVAKDAAQFRCKDGILADVAPTLLFLLGLPQPKEMTGHNLLVPIQSPG